MKRLLLCAAAAAALCASAAFAADTAPAEPSAGALTQAPRYGTWGFDLTSRDLSVKPGDDFFRYAEGAAVAKMVIPPDRSRYGSFDKLRELSDARTRAVLETAASNKAATGEAAKIGAFYRAFMDEARVDQRDAQPLQADLARIKAADSKTVLAAIMGGSNKDFNGTFFASYITTDAKAPTRYAVHLTQAGLGLPNRDYYLQPAFAEQKQKYQAYVAQMLGMIGWPDAEANAKAIVDMETEIAKGSWTLAEQRDDVKTYNPMSPTELAAYAPGFDWNAYLAADDLGGVGRVIVDENTAFPKIAQVFASAPLDTLKAWAAFDLADNAAPYLSKRFDDANFEFRSKTLSGQQEQRARWKRAATLVGGQMGEAVGRIYVAQYFTPEAKAKMDALVAGLHEALQHRIEGLSWMTPETKAEALKKLSMFHVKIGYPVKWRDYSALQISDDDLYGDVERGGAFEWNRRVKRLNDPVDKDEWGMTPQTVNAYYSQTENEIVFPAAILQPPFFDPDADMAVNYGGIGAVIGHEMTHGFDDEGRMSDGTGALRDWWKPEDAAKFQAQASRLGAEYEAIDLPAAPGLHIKGAQTMGENIADLGGVLIALDAYHASLKGKPAPVIDGLTGDQRFFLGWAQVWRAKMRDDILRQRLVSDPHSPDMIRAYAPLRNVDAWYQAFGVKPGDALYIAPDQRVKIW